MHENFVMWCEVIDIIELISKCKSEGGNSYPLGFNPSVDTIESFLNRNYIVLKKASYSSYHEEDEHIGI